jgi:AmmeMemoRadiSam system protein B
MALKKARFAGTWYPGTGKECIRSMKQYDEELASQLGEESSSGFSGGIVPHAGWFFSGKTAYAVFRSIADKATASGTAPDLFYVFGMHLPPGGPNYLFLDEGFETPFGPLLLASDAAEKLSTRFGFVHETVHDSASDNTIELQLPFIKHFFPEAEIVTVGVSPEEGAVSIGEAAYEIAQELDRKPCFIGSTDLTHYGPNYGFIPHGIGSQSVRWVKDCNDREVIEAFLRAEPRDMMRRALSSHNACCPGAAAAAIAAVRRGGTKKGFLIDYTTSYDRHPDSSFVGYAGVLY